MDLFFLGARALENVECLVHVVSCSLSGARALPTQLRSPRVRFVRALFTIMSSWAAVYVYLYILLATYRQFVLLDVLQLAVYT